MYVKYRSHHFPVYETPYDYMKWATRPLVSTSNATV